MFATSGTYPWSFVTKIFHSDQPSHDDDRERCLQSVSMQSVPITTHGVSFHRVLRFPPPIKLTATK
jgi:hypothetical protein